MISGGSEAKPHSGEGLVMKSYPVVCLMICLPSYRSLRRGDFGYRLLTALRCGKIPFCVGSESHSASGNRDPGMPFVMPLIILQLIRGPTFDLEIPLTTRDRFPGSQHNFK